MIARYFWEARCAQIVSKYPECDDDYQGDMLCNPSEEDMTFYDNHCADDEGSEDEEGELSDVSIFHFKLYF